MDCSNSKYPKFSMAVNAVMEAIQADDDDAVETAIQQLCTAQDEEMSLGVSDPEGVLLQFRAISGAVENHLRKGDTLSASMCLAELLDIYDDMFERLSFTLEEIWPIEKLIRETAKHVRRTLKKSLKEEQPEQNETIKEEQSKYEKTIGPCALCREKEALCTGSHLAPHFLIQSFLSYNNSTVRDTEVVNETTMAGYKKIRKWGRRVPEDAIDKTFGDVPTEEKVTIKPSSVTRDYVFCKDCERRFGYIETAYANSFRKYKSCENALLAYIFWLGVFWRLSIGKMALQLSAKDEKAIGEILHCHMTHDDKGVKNMVVDGDMGCYGYRVYHCNDTKGELSGVIGMHTDQSPYWLLLGDFVVVLYSNKEKVSRDGFINDFENGEQWQEIPFIDYWKMKQKILDANAAYENSHMGDGLEKIVDVVKGDHLEYLPSFLRPFAEEMSIDEIKGRTLYQMNIPGSIEKVIALIERHPEADTVEKRQALVKNELGYTSEEMQEMFDYWDKHAKIRRIQMVNKKIKKTARTTKSRAKKKRRMRKRKKS